MVDYLRELHCKDVIRSYLEVMMKMNSLAMAVIRMIGNSIWKSLPLCLRQPIPPGRHGICHKWHKWHLCKMILGVGKIVKNWRDKLPILWNLSNSGQSFHKITGNWTHFVLSMSQSHLTALSPFCISYLRNFRVKLARLNHNNLH